MSDQSFNYDRTEEWIISLQAHNSASRPAEEEPMQVDSAPLAITNIRANSLAANNAINFSSVALPTIDIDSFTGATSVPKLNIDHVSKCFGSNVDRAENTLRNDNRLRPVGGAKLMLSKSSTDSSFQRRSSAVDCDQLSSASVLSPTPSSVFFDEDTQDSGYTTASHTTKSVSTASLWSQNEQTPRFGSNSCVSPMGQGRLPASDGFLVDITNKEVSSSNDDDLYASLFSGDLKDGASNFHYQFPSDDLTPKKRMLFEISEENDSPFLFNNGKKFAQKATYHQMANVKRHKSVLFEQHSAESGLSISRCYSEADVMNALQHGDRRDMIGDYSTVHALPTVPKPRVPDLINIDGHVISRLLSGHFAEISKYTIVDCRYPYEYAGGHIKQAINIYTKEQLDERLFCKDVISTQLSKRNTREIIIFYCEFSQERGPNMSRYLRAKDRRLNDGHYPRLVHPEIYLLDGGYKNFFPSFREFCEPQTYVPMLHQNFSSELRKFRGKSKSWSSDATTPFPGKLQVSRKVEF